MKSACQKFSMRFIRCHSKKEWFNHKGAAAHKAKSIIVRCLKKSHLKVLTPPIYSLSLLALSKAEKTATLKPPGTNFLLLLCEKGAVGLKFRVSKSAQKRVTLRTAWDNRGEQWRYIKNRFRESVLRKLRDLQSVIEGDGRRKKPFKKFTKEFKLLSTYVNSSRSLSLIATPQLYQIGGTEFSNIGFFIRGSEWNFLRYFWNKWR